MRARRGKARVGAAVGLAVFLLTASASQAAASVTLGQLAPGSPPAVTCPTGFQFDLLQPTVTSGNTYVVPGNGTITSWSTNASANAGQMHSMKVFRNVSGLTYLVVGHGGPHPMASGLNAFPASVAVKPGDVLGLSINSATGSTCQFSAPGDRYLSRMGTPGGLPDGASGTFLVQPNFRVNVAAVFEPTNTFTFGVASRNKKKGTATLPVNVPNPGELTTSGRGVKAAGARTSVAVSTGTVQVTIKAKGKKKRKLNEKGKVKLSPTITYTPTGGIAATQSTALKLKKKLKK